MVLITKAEGYNFSDIKYIFKNQKRKFRSKYTD